jgi:hypothetical protein
LYLFLKTPSEGETTCHSPSLELSMRPTLACFLLLGLTQCAPPPGPPAEPPQVAEEAVPDARFCARAPEKAALQVAALKSRLMVTALACDANEKYNAFINANRPALLPQEKALSSYFARNYGRRAQAEHDEYITSLANAQSRRRTVDSYWFCRQGAQLYSEVAALKSPAELPPYAATKVISQPVNITECPAAAPTPSRASPARTPPVRR